MQLFNKITYDKFQDLIQNSRVLKGEPPEPSVLITPHNEVVKIFSPSKRLFTPSRIIPYGKYFFINSKRLTKKGFNTVKIKKLLYVRGIKKYVAMYEFIEGIDVNSHLKQSWDLMFVNKIITLLRNLHEAGIYFRDFHLGNILLDKDNKFHIIDVHSVRTRYPFLRIARRVSNLLKWFSRVEDFYFFEKLGHQFIIDQYLEGALLTTKQKHKFTRIIDRQKYSSPNFNFKEV